VKSCRSVVSVSVVAVGLLGLSACGGDKPSGLPVYTPGASSSSSPSSTATSKWTPEQQQVIDGFNRFTDFTMAIWTKAENIDMAKAHRVAKEPFATLTMKDIEEVLSTGYVEMGKRVYTISSVTAAGGTATVKTCIDQTQRKLINPADPSSPAARNPPPSMATVSLVREGGSWLVTGLKGGEGPCATG
jgi:hypothetical protein